MEKIMSKTKAKSPSRPRDKTLGKKLITMLDVTMRDKEIDDVKKIADISALIETGGKDAVVSAAMELLVQIVRGDPIDGDESEVKPASLSQRIAAAQILLRMRAKKSANGNSPVQEGVHQAGIDIPVRSENFDEWLARAQKMSLQ